MKQKDIKKHVESGHLFVDKENLRDWLFSEQTNERMTFLFNAWKNLTEHG